MAVKPIPDTSPREILKGPVRKLSDSIACSIVKMAGRGS